MPVTISCQSCKVLFSIPPSRVATTRFCSANCYTVAKRKKLYNQHLSKRQTKTCGYCHKQYTVAASRIMKSAYCSYSCKQRDATGPRANHWKGDEVGYGGLHEWVRKEQGTPSLCKHCGTITAKRFEWANISGEYRRDLSDWIRLCKKCHHAFDGVSEKVWAARRAVK